MEIPKKAKDIFKEGEELIEKQEYEEALKKFEQALKIAPRFSDAMSYAAIAHFRLKNKYLSGEEAFNMARKAWESNKSSPITLNNMGIAYLIHHKDLDKSKDYYLKAVQADIKYYKAWANLGLIHTAKKDYESSIKCYKVALGLKPSNVQILNFLGNSYRFNDNPDMAILIYMKALGIDPNHAASSTNLRLAHFQKKDYEGAINFFDLMIKIRPENIMMHLN
ncbi:MAG: tetratricopeptide repeat protein, partial [Promethearchaeota archaeon]